MKRLSIVLAAVVTAGLASWLLVPVPASGAVNPLVSYLSKSTNPHIARFAYLLSTAIWPTRPRVYVCWDNPSQQYANEMELVRKAVGETWEKESALQFQGWATCAKNNEGIRITIADVGPYTRGLGKQLQVDGPNGSPKGKEPGGMFLNFTFQTWSPTCASSPEQRAMCIRSIAIHEFGHAIGFSHEQNRPDKPGECTEKPQGGNGDTLLTPYDRESVMNYCFNIYNPDLKLSKWDIDGVRQIYGSNTSN